MPRGARIVVADVAHQVTPRGNGRQSILATDAERAVYLTMVRDPLAEISGGGRVGSRPARDLPMYPDRPSARAGSIHPDAGGAYRAQADPAPARPSSKTNAPQHRPARGNVIGGKVIV